MELCQTQSDELGVQSPPPAWDASFLEPRRAVPHGDARGTKPGPWKRAQGLSCPLEMSTVLEVPHPPGCPST